MRALVLVMGVMTAAAHAEKPVTLVARTTSVELFVPVKRETWTLRIDENDHATLERVQEDADLPAEKPAPKPRLEDAARRGEALAKNLEWKPSLSETYEGDVKRGKERMSLKLGTVLLDCSRRKMTVHPAGAKLGLPAGSKECGDVKLKWAEPTGSKPVEVLKCMLQGGDDSLDSQLSFGPVPGVDHVIEEDDCAGGDGLRLLPP